LTKKPKNGKLKRRRIVKRRPRLKKLVKKTKKKKN